MTRLFCALAGLLLAGTSLGQPSSTGPLAPPANGPRHADSTFVAIVDCTVHATPGASAEHATVVFRDGRIVSVAAAEKGAEGKGPNAPAAPAGAKVIEGKGLHVYPGFVDAYVEVDAPAPEGDPAALHWNRKVTPQRSALDGAGVDAGTAESLRKMGFATACISPRGGVFRGTAAVVSLAKAPDEQSAAKPPVYREKAYQSVAMEAGGGGYPSSEMGAIALIRQTMLDAHWQDTARSVGQVIAPNALDALIPVWTADAKMKAGGYHTTPQFLCDANDELEVLRYIKVLREFNHEGLVLGCGTEYQRLEAITQACKAAELDSETQKYEMANERPIRFVLPINFPKAPDVSTYAKAEAVELRDLMTWEQAPTNPRRMAKAGIRFALTTAKLGNRGEFAANLKTALKYGLTEEQAIAALTTVPAEMLGVSDQVGTVEEGKRANLIVADGPIFGEKTKIRTVFIDGQAHEISTAPVDLEGRWDLAVAGQPVEGHWLGIDKDNGVTVHLKDKSSKASKVAADAGKISFVFDHEPLDGTEGVFVISAVIEKDAAGKAAKFTGQGMKADGTAFAWTGTRRGPSLDGLWPTKFSGELQHESPVLLIDKDGKVTMWNAPKDADGKALEPENVKIENGTLTYDFDQGKLGKEGVSGVAKVSATVDFTKTPPVMAGVVNAPGGEKFAWTATRRNANPLTGPWRVTKADDKEFDLKSKEGLAMDVSERGVTLTFTKKKEGEEKLEKTVVRAEDVKFEEGTLTFTHDLSKLGGEGKSSDTVKIKFGAELKEDTLTGEGLVEDSKHAYAAARKVEEPVQVAAGLTMTPDEAERIKGVPEKLPLPFGPYGFLEQPKQADVLFTNATIWTNGPAGVLKGGLLHIKNGKIAEFGPNPFASTSGDAAGQPGMTVIDCQGRSITPGIIDCHSHTGISRGVNEGGQAVTSECRIADVTDPDAISWYRQLAGGVTEVNSLHGSANAIGGQSQTNKVRWGCVNPDEMHFAGAKPGVKFALGENPRQVNFGGGGRRGQGNDAPAVRYPATRMGVETLIRDRFTAAREYDRTWQEYMGSAQSAESTAAAAKAVDKDVKARADVLRKSVKDSETEGARIDGMIKDIDDQIAKLKAGKQTSTNQVESLNKSREQYVAMKANNTQNRDRLAARLAELSASAGTKSKGGAEASAGGSRTAGSERRPTQVPPRRDLELEALAEVLRGDRLVHCHSYRQDEILMLCMVARDFGFKIGTFQHALEGYKVADYIRDTTTGGASGFADWWAYKVEVQDAIPEAFPIMHDVGVNVSFNSDSDELARRLNVDAAKAVKYGGLTEEEALKFVTINPAKQLQIDSKVGSIEVGKDADLAIWNGDPLSSMSMCVATYVDGRCLFSTEQDEAARKSVAAERQRLLQKILNENRPKRDEGDSAEGDGPRRGPGGFGGGGRRRGPRPPQE